MTFSGSGAGGRPVGLPKTGGRGKGTPNRKTSVLQEKLAVLRCDPAEELVKIARDPKTETGLKAQIYCLFVRYTHPTPKPSDHSNEEDATANGSMITVEDAIQWAKYVMERFGQNAAPQEENLTPETEGEADLPDKEREE